MIIIHYDFTDGTEISYMEGRKLKNNFTTCCVNFFQFSYLKLDKTNGLAEDIIVLKKNGDYLSAKKLIENKYEFDAEIRLPHNIMKILVAGGFLDEYWDKNFNLKLAELYANDKIMIGFENQKF